MHEADHSIRSDSSPPTRTLKIEAHGDFWKGVIKPKIRLMGRWLERAGFKPGHRVRVVCVAHGIIELHSHDELAAPNEGHASSEEREHSL